MIAFRVLHRVQFRLAPAAPRRVHGGAQEIHVVHARQFDRVLEREEHTGSRSFIGGERQQIQAQIRDRARRDLIAGLAREDTGQCRLSGAVGAHDGMDLAGIDGQVDAFDDVPSAGEAGSAGREFPGPGSSDTPFKADGEQFLRLDREFHRQFLQHFLAEAVDDQRYRIL